MCRAAASLLSCRQLATAIEPAVGIRVATFNIGPHFVDTYFDYSLGEPGTSDYESVGSALVRIIGDVVCFAGNPLGGFGEFLA